jgi:hypothetical protein
MKPPASLPPLGAPHYLFGEPAAVQYAIIFLCWTCAAFAGWLSWNRFNAPDTVPGFNILVAMLGAAFLLIPFSPKLWRRWVRLAADPKGIYILCNWHLFQPGDFYQFIPWQDVGKSSTAFVGAGGDTSPSVVLKLRVTDEIWEKLAGTLPKGPEDLRTPKDGNGYRQFPLGNHCRDVPNTRAEIEKIRSLAAP